MGTELRQWIAFELDESGWQSEAYLVVAAESSRQAREVMRDAIDTRASIATPALRRRLYDIFIEAPRELADDDPRGMTVGPDRAFLSGFEREETPR